MQEKEALSFPMCTKNERERIAEQQSLFLSFVLSMRFSRHFASWGRQRRAAAGKVAKNHRPALAMSLPDLLFLVGWLLLLLLPPPLLLKRRLGP